jgi:pyridinium-3,5-biscarboxylic acid mononucleotide sulfurtransferase
MARLEVPVEEISRMCDPAIRPALLAELKRLGFKYVTLDLEGFRSGSQNLVLAEGLRLKA